MPFLSLAWQAHLRRCAAKPTVQSIVPHARRLLAALMAHPPGLRRAPSSDIHLQRAAARRAGSDRRAIARGGPGQHVHAPAALHHGHPLAAQQVPAVPA